MKTIIVTDINQTVDVRYLVDMIAIDSEAVTIMDIQGLTNSDQTIGLFTKKIVHNLSDFTTMAQNAGLKVTVTSQENGISNTTVLCDYTGEYNNGGLGLDAI